jgi:hypothetical protein
MEAHPEYRCFTLDGQTIVIEDYLELRPENEGRLRALIEAGRIVIGPWLVKQFCRAVNRTSAVCSAASASPSGSAAASVGHCADQFGHIAQMPQLMRQLGLTSACLWRGVPDAIPGWSFWWEAPDGTRLPVLYLRNSYSSGWRLRTTWKTCSNAPAARRPTAETTSPPLMNGTDHCGSSAMCRRRWRPRRPRYEYQMVTLGEYEQAQLDADRRGHVGRRTAVAGPVERARRGAVSRMNIKQRDFEVSGAIEKYAEPLELLAHLHGGPDCMPALKQAWRLLLENSPHDSICGCSVDQTHREMMPRYDRAEQLAKQVARESLWHLTRRLEAPEPGDLWCGDRWRMLKRSWSATCGLMAGGGTAAAGWHRRALLARTGR